MNRLIKVAESLMLIMAFLLAAIATGCGGGGGGAPILGLSGLPALTAATLTDLIKPRVISTYPAASGVAASNVAITATFSEEILAATINTPATSFALVDTTASAVVAASGVTGVNYASASKTATFTPAASLIVGHIYTATIKGTGANPVKDLAGNPLAGNQAPLPAASDYIWQFTAGAADLTPPTIILTSPANGASGVALNSSINTTFSKAMNLATLCDASNTTVACPVASFTLATSAVSPVPVSGVVSYDPLSMIATFVPSANLAASTSYIATVTAATTDLAGNHLAVPAVGLPSNPWFFTTGTGLAPGAINLGTASTFGLMATAAITAANASIINGDVSLEPGSSITGFPPALVNGTVHVNDTVSHQARADLLVAYNTAKGIACGTNVGTVDLGVLVIPPGVYCSGSTMSVATNLVLNAGGNANAVWVFQIGSSLTTTANVTLTGGAQAKNVFWVPTADVTVGSGTTFYGTIVAGRDATSAGSATINGRILAGAITAGTIALNGPPSTVNVPAP
jgi:hypothetical protein